MTDSDDAEQPSDVSKGTVGRFLDRNPLPITLFTAFALGCVVLVGIGSSYKEMSVFPALLWALAFGASGILLGFIFAIPRIPRTLEATAEGKPLAATKTTQGSQAAASETIEPQPRPEAAPFNEVNSNLVEVSDWITKIIVGVGLVELKELPGKAAAISAFIAPSIGMSTAVGKPVAGGIMLYFSVLGFLSGYLLTRVYLAVIFKKADELVRQQGQILRLSSGREIESGRLALLQQTALEDVQRQVASIATPARLTEAAPAATTPVPRRVLWVDDHPENNVLLVDQLMREGVTVIQERSTAAALKRLESDPVDLVVSDMARYEDGRDVDDAGIVLLNRLGTLHPRLPSLIYCSAQMVRRYGVEAEHAGSLLVTSSGTRLLSQIKQHFGLL